MTVVKACTRLTRLYGKYLLCPNNILFNSARLSHHCVCMNINRTHGKKGFYTWLQCSCRTVAHLLTGSSRIHANNVPECGTSLKYSNSKYLLYASLSFIHSLETERRKLNIMNYSIICYEMCAGNNGDMALFCYTGLHAQCYLRSLTHITSSCTNV